MLHYLRGLVLFGSLVTVPPAIAATSGEHAHAHHHSGHDHTRPDSHEPIGMMSDHLMRKGEIMLSYRYMYMDMDGNRTGTNDNGYTLGNKLDLSAWIARKIAASTSLSFRLNGLDWDNSDGAHTRLSPTPTLPTKDSELRDGTRLDALAGINFVIPNVQELRLAAEAGVPVYQDLDGPQLETDLVFTLGAQYTF